MTPTIPNEHAIKSDFLLPIFINSPPLTAPIVIPATTDVPIKAYFDVARDSLSYQPNFAFSKDVTWFEYAIAYPRRTPVTLMKNTNVHIKLILTDMFNLDYARL